MDVRNAEFDAYGNILCEVNHPAFGWIPFTASASDPSGNGRAIHAAALALDPTLHPSPDISGLKREAFAALADRRYRAEVGGITVGGVAIATDRRTQAVLTSAYVKASQSVSYEISNWKSPSGVFSSLTSAQIIATANAVMDHVQDCFDNEATLSAAITSATTAAELAAVDIESGWP